MNRSFTERPSIINSSPLRITFLFLLTALSVIPIQNISGQENTEKEEAELKNDSFVKLESIHIDTGVLFLANDVYDTAVKDIGNPVVSYTLGATLPLYFTKNIFIAPSLLFFTSIYSPSNLTDLALPADSAEADTLTTLGMWIDVSAGYKFIFNRWQLGVQGGLAFLIRIPLWGPASDEERTEIAEGLYQNGRFIYISTGVWASILMTDKMDLIIRYKTEIPIFNVWCNSGLTFFDQWGMDLTLGFALHF